MLPVIALNDPFTFAATAVLAGWWGFAWGAF